MENMAVPSQAIVARLISYQRHAEPLPNGIASNAVQVRDTCRSTPCLHNAEEHFNVFGRRSTLSTVHCY